MDGTGELFSDFVDALPVWVVPEIIRFPGTKSLSCTQLEAETRSALSGPGPFVLLGESFSSPLAVSLAASAPNGLCGLVICAGFVAPPVWGALRAVASLITPAACWAVQSRSAARILLGPDAPQPLVKKLRSAIYSVNPGVMADRLRAVLKCDAQAELRRVPVPILYIAATKDLLVREASLRIVQRIRPDTEVARISGPHLVAQREPSDTAKAVTEFLRRIT
jgi:pimeloyl-ACP methyl ester carboxylesterase